jgi:hypothetical protein
MNEDLLQTEKVLLRECCMRPLLSEVMTVVHTPR